MSKIPVVAIVGPTAVGKTKLSIEIAKKFNGEIISGDSMQIYRGLDIGTAKVKREEMEGIPHYMIDIKEPQDSFSVAEFKEKVEQHIKDIDNRHLLPILVGGTGLYIQSTLYGFNFSEHKRDPAFEEKIRKQIEQEGITPIYEKLIRVDPEQAKNIHPNNIRRVIRALEVYEQTGKTMSELQAEQQKVESPYAPILIGLEMEREELYRRINKRIDQMLDEGLLEEVKALYDKGLKDAQCMQGIGYKEFIPFFEGEKTLDEVIEELKRNSRRYAKRQYTYFKNKLDVHWFPISESTMEQTFLVIFQELEGLLKNITK